MNAWMMIAVVVCGGPPGTPSEELRKGVEDVSPLAPRVWSPPASLGVDNDFERVFRMRDSAGQPTGRLARVANGITAVFPESRYWGTTPTIPAGTVFHVGSLSRAHEAAAVAPSVLSASTAAAGRQDLRWRPTPRASADLPREPLSIWNDEAYRRRRIAQLLGG